MKRKWIFKGIGISAFFILSILLMGLVVMLLWNWLMPHLFGLPQITHLEALGLLLLSKILFGGFGRGHRGRHKGKRFWKGRMKEKWKKMTPEQREKFKTGMRCGPWADIKETKEKDEPSDLV